MPMISALQQQLDDLIDRINRLDGQHRALIERRKVIEGKYLATPRNRTVLAERNAVVKEIAPYQVQRNELAAQARRLEEQIRQERINQATTVSATAEPEIVAAADYARQQAELDALLAEQELPQPQQQVVAIRYGHRTLTQIPITFTCQDCGQTLTRLQYPGGPPKRCDACKKIHHRARIAAAMREIRARKRAEKSSTES